MTDLNKLVEELSKLTVVEAAELSKKLEEAWGVSAAAAPVAVAMPGAAGGAAEATRQLARLAAAAPKPWAGGAS